MKSIENIKKDWVDKIQNNNLKVIKYYSINDVECICNICERKFKDYARNLSYKYFKCKYCKLTNDSELINAKIVELIDIKGKIISLKCNKGHLYNQSRGNLLKNKKCIKCYLQNKVFTKDKILEKFIFLHGDNYEYNFINFKNVHSKIKIICKKNHIFFQKISNHLQGKGCPVCRESFGERTVSIFLLSKNIIFETQKTFNDLIFINKLKFDFYLPKYNICIEYDGIQHFKSIEFLGGEKEFIKNKQRDLLKNEYCYNNNIKIIRFSYKENLILKLNEFYLTLENEVFLTT